MTFTAGEHVTMEKTSVTVRTGTTFGSVSKPSYTLADNYTFDGWFKDDGTKVEDTTAITSDLPVTAKLRQAVYILPERRQRPDSEPDRRL